MNLETESDLLGQWLLLSNLYGGQIILQYKINHLGLMVFVNSRV
jgi:hypothetical protein